MPDSMNTEQLQSGQAMKELGSSHAANIGFGEPRDLRPDDVKQMFGPARTPLQQFEAAGMVERSKTKMGGGAGPVDEYFAKIETASVDKINKFLEWADQRNTAGVSRVNIGGVTVSLAEYRLRMEQALAMKQVRHPERQQTGQPVDWKTSLQPDQRQRLQAFETKIAGFEQGQLQIVSNRLRELQAQALTDGWQGKEIKEADVNFCLKIIEEKLMSISHGQEVVKISERVDLIQDLMRNLSGEARGHLQLLTERFKREKSLSNLDFSDLVVYVQAEYRKASLIGRNAPLWLLPPHLKRELSPIFGLQAEMPILQEPKEKNA